MAGNSIFTRISFAALALVLFAACSARIEGGSGQPPPLKPSVKPFNHLVPGPSLNGTWKSACVADARYPSTWGMITLSINEQAIIRHVDLYSDSACTKPLRIQDEDGEFRYSKKRGENKFAVEYRFKMEGGHYSQYENFTLESDSVLWISNEIGGDVEPDVKLMKVGVVSRQPEPPAPVPVPAPVPAPSPETPRPVVVVGQHVAKYGDRIEIRGLANGIEQTETYTNQGYDDRERTWTIFIKIEGARTTMGYRYFSSIWSSRETQSTFANCTAKGGSIQVITVRAGTFQTCMIDEGARVVWYGDAPILGKVKVESKDGSYKSELYSYVWGDVG